MADAVHDTAQDPAIDRLLAELGLVLEEPSGGTLTVRTPIDGGEIARVAVSEPAEVEAAVAGAEAAFLAWRSVPGPRRGELIRLLGEELRAHKQALGRLVTIETGKILQ